MLGVRNGTLRLIPQKVKLFTLGTGSVPKTPFQFTCGKIEFRVVAKYFYLGLWLNEHLAFKDTASEVAKSAHRALGLLISKFELMYRDALCPFNYLI